MITSIMSIGIRHSITAGQCRAARALLDITQPELADAAGLGLSTIVDFEKSRRDVSRAAVPAMQKALEKAEIRFLAKNGGDPRVRLRQCAATGPRCAARRTAARGAWLTT